MTDRARKLKSMLGKGRMRFCLMGAVALLALVACTETSPSLNKYFGGQTLVLNVMNIERTQELRYSTIDPQEVIRDWRLVPSSFDQELIMLRMKVENHIAVNVIVDVSQEPAELRNFFSDSYFSLDLGSRMHQDLRNTPQVTLPTNQELCSKPVNMYVTQGTTVDWVNEGTVDQVVTLNREDRLRRVQERGDSLPIPPGGIYSHTFNYPGVVEYQCSSGDVDGLPVRIEVVPPAEGEANEDYRSFTTGTCEDRTNVGTKFLTGAFDLKKDTCIEGWVVFEAPKDTKIRTLRWRAGDTIFIDF